MTPCQMLGNDTWFEYQLNCHREEGMGFSFALEKTVSEWEAIRHLTRMELVELDVDEVLTSLQEQSVALMGVTVQGLALATRTVLQLKDLDISLFRTAPWQNDYCFPVEEHTVLYRQGILFTSGKAKGKTFFQFCENLNLCPKRIVAIDDKGSHLKIFEHEAEKRGVEFVGLRYSGCDARKQAFNRELAEIQWNLSTFAHILSDDEARQVFEKSRKDLNGSLFLKE
jgi:hypothetical protein